MRGVLVTMVLVIAGVAGCTSTTVQEANTRAFCQIVCDCGLLVGAPGITQDNCPDQCVSTLGTQDIPDACMSCLYEQEHSCASLQLTCAPSCQTNTSTPTPLIDLVQGGTR